uniref:Biotin carboxyl carrier protein of acetyl-CoA carboxylase n=1 Tax=Halydictyon mirabile TaxID=189652 RepID=A0A4D6WTC2_9FLOR|nr:acetyl-CoA carboxylase, biotin carboxyl carrier protein [Halydictyon mirabile]
MIFTLNTLKKFVYSIKNKQIKNIKIKNSNLEIIINNNQIKTLNQSKDINFKPKLARENYKNTNNNKQKQSLIIEKSIKNSTNNKTELDCYSTIVSPMVGTFYRSPAPNEPTFIEKHDQVKRNQTVCIIEAMKLMNEIESEVNGEIIDILVDDGDIVDCGQALINVKIK